MCGRYSITTPVEGLRQLFLFEEVPNLAPRYNVAPTQEVPVVRLEGEEEPNRHLRMLRWGLIPSWAKDRKIAYKTINARAETVAEKPSFRTAFRRRRCLILADGFYEWRKEGEAKQPYRIVMADRGPFAMAGLWESWRDPEDKSLVESCTIIVTEANSYLSRLHHRMPVILAPEDHAAWLDPSAAGAALQALMKPFEAAPLTAYPVSTHVNKPANDDPACIDAIGEEIAAASPAAKQASLI